MRSSAIAFLVAVVGCASPGDLPVQACRRQPFDPDSSPVDPYWPPGTFLPDSFADEMIRDWFSTQLCAMNQPPLEQLVGDEIYRFLWLRSYHSPISVRLVQLDGAIELTSTRISAQTEEPGFAQVLEHSTRPIAGSDFASFRAEIDTSDVWNMPSWPPPHVTLDELTTTRFDGAIWFIEIRRNGTIHRVATNYPEQHEALRKALIHLLELSRLDVDPIY